MTKGGSGGQTDGLGATAATLTVRREGLKKKMNRMEDVQRGSAETLEQVV